MHETNQQPQAPMPGVDARSNEVQEILGRTPHWLLRWGIVAIGSCLLVVLLLAWMVKYPDIIEAPVKITGTNPAAPVVAHVDGHLEKLFVTENQRVEKGALLAVIKSPADAERVFDLKERTEALRPILENAGALPELTLDTGAQLGRLQSSYSELFSGYTRYRRTLADDYADKTGATLERQLQSKRKQIAFMQQQTSTSQKELDLAAANFARISGLRERGSLSVSKSGIDAQQKSLFEKQRQHSTVQKALLGEEIAAAGFEKDIRDLEHKREEELRGALSGVRESLKKLLSDIQIWENDYALRAPVAGTVAFYEFWTDQQYVKSGDQVFIIAPETSALLARIQIKARGAGKIAAGQMVRIKLDDFPHKEFGMVSGEVKSISQVAREGAYQVMVSLDYPLRTTYKKELPFKQDMTGEAGIVTARRSLLGRIFNEFRKIFSKGA